MIDLRKSAELNGMEPMELYARFMRFPSSDKRVICYCEMCGRERILPYRGYHDLCKRCGSRTTRTRIKRSESAIERFKDPDECRRQSERLTRYFSNQDNRDRDAEGQRKRWDNLDERKGASDKTIAWFEDPKHREEASAREQGISHDEWTGFSKPHNNYESCIFLNDPFSGCHRHHITETIIICIPRELHNNVKHCFKTGYNMGMINLLALQFMNGGLNE